MNKKLTHLDIKKQTNGAGLFCISLRDEDYIALGSSIFIGVKKLTTGYVQLKIASADEVQVTHFKFRREDNGQTS